jgi:hypothetical protein
MPDNQSAGFISGSSSGNHASAIEFFFRRAMAQVATATLVKVVAVYSVDGIAAPGLLDVQPLLNQIDGQGNITVRPVVYGVPFSRVQSGTNAIIMDPVVGDIGVCCFGDRDLSSVISSQAQAPPGSNRRNSMSDALYICSILGKTAPTQYVVFDAEGITLVSPTKVTIQAPTTAVVGALTVSETIVAQGEVTGASVVLGTHLHTGVESGSSESGPPVA